MVSWTDSTFRFLAEQWKDNLPGGYLIKETSIDQPFEEDACQCRFVFVKDATPSICPNLVLKFQWFIGERSLSNFTAIPEAIEQVNGYLLFLCTSFWISSDFLFYMMCYDDNRTCDLGILAKAWGYWQNSESGMHSYAGRYWVSSCLCYVFTCFTRYAFVAFLWKSMLGELL